MEKVGHFLKEDVCRQVDEAAIPRRTQSSNDFRNLYADTGLGIH